MSKELIAIIITALIFPLTAHIYRLVIGRTLIYRAVWIPLTAAGLAASGLMASIHYLDFFLFPFAAALAAVILILSVIIARRHIIKYINSFTAVMWEKEAAQQKNIDELADFLIEIDTKSNKLKRKEKDLSQAKADIKKMVEAISLKTEEAVTRFDQHASIVNELTGVNNGIIKLLNENAKNAETISRTAKKSAVKIDVNNKNVQKSARTLNKIINKIRVIDDIAFQTNILALNAAIEAAKAGEYGKEFAVVASSIQKLSVKSKSSAAEINDISNSGVQLSKRTGRISKQIVPDIKATAKQIKDIARKTKRQHQEATGLNRTISMLSDELGLFIDTSKEIKNMAEELQQRINIGMHQGSETAEDENMFSDDEFADEMFSDDEFADENPELPEETQEAKEQGNTLDDTNESPNDEEPEFRNPDKGDEGEEDENDKSKK